MNDILRDLLWAAVWRAEWSGVHLAPTKMPTHLPWLYLLNDDDLTRLGDILNRWLGYPPGSDAWALDAIGQPLFAFRYGLPEGDAEAILLCRREGYSPMSAVPLVATPGAPSGKAGADLRYGHMRHVKEQAFDRALSLARRNHPVVALGMVTLEAAVLSARPYLERKDGKWARALPGKARPGIPTPRRGGASSWP